LTRAAFVETIAANRVEGRFRGRTTTKSLDSDANCVCLPADAGADRRDDREERNSVKRTLVLTTPHMESDDVKYAQQLLRKAGYLDDKADGEYGPLTAQARVVFVHASK
jgi:hypothetical protein